MKEIITTLIKFSAVGMINSIVDACAFFILVALGMHIVLAQFIAYGFGMLNSYIFNGKWTFKSKQIANAERMIRFIAVNLVTLGISSTMLVVLYDKLFFPLIFSKAIVIVIGMLINYAGSRYWVFRPVG